MNKRRISVQLLLYFFMLMFLMIIVSCSSSSSSPPATTTTTTTYTYTVTFDSQSATVAASPTSEMVTSPATTLGTLPVAPTRSGYIFGGWYTGISGSGTWFDASTIVTADITVYARWIYYSYTVKFDSQGATGTADPPSIIVASPATTVGTLPTTYRTGYNFAGWWTGVGGTGTEFTASTPVTASITVYAYWSTNPVYTVTFDSQGGTAVGSQHVTSPATTVGTLPAAPTRSGYKFNRWYTGTGGTGTEFTANTTVTANITLYAYWESYTYTVTFDSQGATVAASPTSEMVTSPATTVGTLPAAPTKTGYIFAGWWTGIGGTGTEFTASTTVTADITVYAYWSTNPVYTVTYDSQGGTAVDAQIVISPATTVGTLPAKPTKTDYTFAGWWTGIGGSGTEFTASTPVTASITVYAYWSANPVHTVTYDSQGGTAVDAQHVTSPATTVGTLPVAPTRSGYIFGGWYTGTGGSGTWFDASTIVTADITVYAKWNSYTYTVSFNSQGATGTADPPRIIVASPATTVGTLPTTYRTGYNFAGWWTGVGGTGTEFTATTPVMASITVYAYWSTNPVYTVTFDSQGGTAVGSQHVTSPATTVGTLPTAPTMSGYTFGGWWTGTGGTGTAFTASTPVTANITVYAYWE